MNDSETLVAPQEVRELLTRLTEQNVEAIDATEIRTLGGLAARTGIPIEKLRRNLDRIRGRRPRLAWIVVSLAALAIGWLVLRAVMVDAPKVEVMPSYPVRSLPDDSADRSGLVGLDTVTYGPDSGTYQVDPTFEPSYSLPAGISISATYQNVLWGAGDHHAIALTRPLSAAQEARMLRAVEELVLYTLSQIKARRLDTGDGDRIDLTFTTITYGGTFMSRGSFPLEVENESAIRTPARSLARNVVNQLQQHLDWHRRSRVDALRR